ncbi:MAG: cupin domain-containing protein [Candidatus Contendobacter sp.]|nr:cupin domain-containing protein [Candidatus Contendobacter sp.]
MSSGFKDGELTLLKIKPLLVALSLAVANVSTRVVADDTLPTPILPDNLHWIDAPGGLPLQAVWILGAELKPEPYLIRVKLNAGGRIPPHTHPDARNSTVLSGTLYVGFGATFDELKLVAIPSGAVYVAPAQVPHFVAAKEAVLYQEAGMGPTGTILVKP